MTLALVRLLTLSGAKDGRFILGHCLDQLHLASSILAPPATCGQIRNAMTIIEFPVTTPGTGLGPSISAVLVKPSTPGLAAPKTVERTNGEADEVTIAAAGDEPAYTTELRSVFLQLRLQMRLGILDG